MRTFTDNEGRTWVASVRERPGHDYKGRYHFFMVPRGADESNGLALLDIRWNTERTARRTLETMSDVELRRRLRQALGRHPYAAPSPAAATEE
ncbi:MAG: hypothetical protein PVI57_06915 [Gemmatimonadota bacterium]|jgi:hypothetical protein